MRVQCLYLQNYTFDEFCGTFLFDKASRENHRVKPLYFHPVWFCSKHEP